MAFSLACDAGKTTLRIEGADNNVTWNAVANAGAGSVAVDGGGAEDPSFFVTEHVANGIYQILKNVQFGDGSNSLTFYSKKETVYFDNDRTFTIKNNATLQLGEVNESYCINGACWSWEQAKEVIGTGDSAAACKIYDSKMHLRGTGAVDFIAGTVDFRNSLFSAAVGVYGAFAFRSGLASLILKDLYVSSHYAWNVELTPDVIENVWFHNTDIGVAFYASATVEDLLVTGSDIKIKLGDVGGVIVNVVNPRWIPVQSEISINYNDGILNCRYTCDIHVVDKDGSNLEGVTVTCEDKDSNQVFSVQTGADGKITQQTITYKKWEGTDEAETEYSPHKFTFSKNGYTLLVMENVTVDARITWDVEVRFPERIRARMANLGRLAVLR